MLVVVLLDFLSKDLWTIDVNPHGYASCSGLLAILNALSSNTLSGNVFLVDL